MLRPLDLFYAIAGLVLAPVWARKARGDWSARFGAGPELPRADRPRLMLHAVSVGEVNALRALVPLLTDRCDLVISVGTDTGIARARALFAADATIVRYPLDFSFAVRRFLNRVRPDAVGLVELEVWPQFVRACVRREAPVCVINGRLSAKSFKGYRRAARAPGVGRVVRGVFERLAWVGAQDEAYAERFRAMGAPVVEVGGSMKWDAAPAAAGGRSAEASALAEAMGIDLDRPLVVGGSTAAGEEALLLAACPARVQLLCAPRKPERFGAAFMDLTADGGACVRRSDGAPGDGATRFLLDTIGELRAAYELADVVVMGRSFGLDDGGLGGSDPIEPAALGRATVVGPGMANFESIRDRLVDAGGLVVCSAEALGGELARLMGDDSARETLASAGLACVASERGASARYAERLLRLAGAGGTGGAGRGEGTQGGA
ncbi:MAG: glycosyltransferase N-terminal domain-containing protein [Planctomycetota bacterium]